MSSLFPPSASIKKTAQQYDIEALVAPQRKFQPSLFHVLLLSRNLTGAGSSIEAFVKRALRPSVQDVDGKKLDEFILSDDIVFLLQLQDEDKILEARFRDFAQEYSDRYSFGITTAKSDRPDGVWCRNSIDQRENDAQDLDDPNSLKNFLKICTAELIPQLTRRNEMAHLSVYPPFH